MVRIQSNYEASNLFINEKLKKEAVSCCEYKDKVKKYEMMIHEYKIKYENLIEETNNRIETLQNKLKELGEKYAIIHLQLNENSYTKAYNNKLYYIIQSIYQSNQVNKARISVETERQWKEIKLILNYFDIFKQNFNTKTILEDRLQVLQSIQADLNIEYIKKSQLTNTFSSHINEIYQFLALLKTELMQWQIECIRLAIEIILLHESKIIDYNKLIEIALEKTSLLYDNKQLLMEIFIASKHNEILKEKCDNLIDRQNLKTVDETQLEL